MIERNPGSPPSSLWTTPYSIISHSLPPNSILAAENQVGRRTGLLQLWRGTWTHRRLPCSRHWACACVRVCVRAWVEREKHKVKRPFRILPRVGIEQTRDAQLKQRRKQTLQHCGNREGGANYYQRRESGYGRLRHQAVCPIFLRLKDSRRIRQMNPCGDPLGAVALHQLSCQ